MYIAMNRFRVLPDRQDDFRRRWLERQSRLASEPGFVAFHLLEGPTHDDHVLYASHTAWRSFEDFEAWTRSEAFRDAHRNAGEGPALTLGHPVFEGFTTIQEVLPDAREE